MKNKYFKTVEEVARKLNLPCNKHHPHSWSVPHSHKRYVTFYHKVLFIDACCNMDFETFNTLFKEMKKFIKMVKINLRELKDGN